MIENCIYSIRTYMYIGCYLFIKEIAFVSKIDESERIFLHVKSYLS